MSFLARFEKLMRLKTCQVNKQEFELKVFIMTFDELVLKLEPFRVGTNRADICWELKNPLPDNELDILNGNAEKLELELDETDYVGYPGRKPYYTKSVYRILFSYKASPAEE